MTLEKFVLNTGKFRISFLHIISVYSKNTINKLLNKSQGGNTII